MIYSLIFAVTASLISVVQEGCLAAGYDQNLSDKTGMMSSNWSVVHASKVPTFPNGNFAGHSNDTLYITEDEMAETIRVLTSGCYSDPTLVPAAIARCVGTSVELINQLLLLLANQVLAIYVTPNQQMREQSYCFLEGLGLWTEEGTLNEAGVQHVLDAINYEADLRNLIAEGVTLCTTPDKEPHDLAMCIQHALLVRCKIENAGNIK